MPTRRRHSPEFKSRVALEAIKGERLINEIAADYCQGQSNNPHCGEVKFPTLALFLLVLDAPFLLAAKVAH